MVQYRTVRAKLSDIDDPVSIVLDIPCEVTDDGSLISIRHLSYYGEWIDSDGDTYQLAARSDGTVDYGYYGNEGTKRATLNVHGRAIGFGTIFEYRSPDPVEDGDFRLTAMFEGSKWVS